MAILRHSRTALTMEIYTQAPDKVTRDALWRLSDQLDSDQADEGEPGATGPGQPGIELSPIPPVAVPICCTRTQRRPVTIR